MSTQEKLDGMIFDIEDYVGGNIEGVENVDRMAFTAFLRKNLTALIDSAKREAYKQGYIDAGIKALTEQSEESI